MGAEPICHLPASRHAFQLLVGQASVPPEQLAAFHAFLLSHLECLLVGMSPMGRYGQGAKAIWNLELSPSGPCFAALSRDLSHAGHYAVLWNELYVLIPVRPSRSTPPPATRTLLIQNVPLSCSRVGLPDALLRLAGYTPVRCPATGPVLPPAADSVVVVQYRLGAHANAAVFVVDVVPPADDPHLRRLPMFARELTEPGHPTFSVLLEADPLPRSVPARVGGPQPAPRPVAPMDVPPLAASPIRPPVPPPARVPQSPSVPAPEPHLPPRAATAPDAALPSPVAGTRRVSPPHGPERQRSGARLPYQLGRPGLDPRSALGYGRVGGRFGGRSGGRRPLLDDPQSFLAVGRQVERADPDSGPRTEPVALAAAPRAPADSDSDTEALCPVCRNALSTGAITYTTCAHAFHEACLHQWFAHGHDSCPTCRYAPLPEADTYIPSALFDLIPDSFPNDDPIPDPLHVPLPDPQPVPELAEPPPAVRSLELSPEPLPAPASGPAAASAARSGSGAPRASPASTSRWWRQGPAPPAPDARSPSPRPSRVTPKRTRGSTPVAVPARAAGIRRSARSRAAPRQFWLDSAGPSSMDIDASGGSHSSSSHGTPPRSRRCPDEAAARRGSAGGEA